MFGVALVLFFTFLNYYQFSYKNKILLSLQCLFFDKNTVSVEVKNIDIKKVTIEFIDHPKNRVIFKNNKKVGRIKREKGFIVFDIFYDGLRIARADIFNQNSNNTYDYFFYLAKNDSIFDFRFKVDDEWTGYRMFTVDKLNKTLTDVYYNKQGKTTGLIGIDYYDDNENVIVDETWKNDTLINLNLYENGDWYKNYSIGKSWKTTVYKLTKEPHNDSLKYIYQTIENGEVVETEIIKVKKQQ